MRLANRPAMSSETRMIGRVGWVSGTCAFGFTIAYGIVQTMQLIHAISFPQDEMLIYGTSLGIAIPFLVTMLSLHYLTPQNKRFWTHGALIFSSAYLIFVTSNYVVQLATVLPAKLSGGIDEIRVLEQTPHSLFWDYDALGYIFMGLSTLAAIPAVARYGFEKWVRYSLIAHSAVTPLIMLVYFYPLYSEHLLILACPWAVTAPLFMLMLAILLFRRSEVLEREVRLECI